MLYVSVLLASFTIRFYPLSYFAYTYTHTHARIYSLCFIWSFCYSSFIFYFIVFSFSLSFTRYSHDRLCNVLANMRSTRYSVLFSDTEAVSNC